MHPQFLVWCLTFGAQFKNDGHYFCGAGGNRPDGSDEALTNVLSRCILLRNRCFYLLCSFLSALLIPFPPDTLTCLRAYPGMIFLLPACM
ncbi:hypothetical protein FQG07_24965 [Escherichia coli]|nr:hypothetical protein [Escherichia coli]